LSGQPDGSDKLIRLYEIFDIKASGSHLQMDEAKRNKPHQWLYRQEKNAPDPITELNPIGRAPPQRLAGIK
jgi:hypothetical protein